ncbi:hypothetical protein FRD01_01875 [Microvenator marinus]|jgi:hypothetical protein|uniref:Uncharacterized protein n=1 Tax=Microvenator marinus TaxID=2600177 RepID=A0A5B8XM34_9DELT|nr:hypothetical protein [Microvenator marinus]QED26028.1 hypothetical protein FRD01_01875 [Microvenator marinus]
MNEIGQVKNSKEFFSSQRIEALISGLRGNERLRLNVQGEALAFDAEIRTHTEGISLVLTTNEAGEWSQFEGLVRSRRGARLVADALSSGNFSTLFSDAEFDLAYVAGPLDMETLPEAWRKHARPLDRLGTHLRNGEVFVHEWVIKLDKLSGVECRLRFKDGVEIGALWKSVQHDEDVVVERFLEDETQAGPRIRRTTRVEWSTDEIWERVQEDELVLGEFRIGLEVLRLSTSN